MEKLTDKEYWNEKYSSKRHQHPPSRKGTTLLKKLVGKNVFEYTRTYADYLLWDVIYRKYMPQTKATVLEVGSAPGTHLVRLHQTFGYVPYGVEYSECGAELNREIFSLHTIDPGNVIQADFLCEEFQQHYQGCFDIVLSRGFIEHFTNAQEVVEKHINLLTRGGLLFVSIPNKRGFNYFLAWLFDRKDIAKHNRAIMQKEEFSKLFKTDLLATLFCGYYGTFDFNVSSMGRTAAVRFMLSVCKRCQLPLHALLRLLLRDKGAETSFLSPYLLFIGEKKE